tara:strand:- start:433 stop:681 length:249 start_codon:yes stop_codon:yes gene_type:complete
MIKYSVPDNLVKELLKLQVCATEEEAIEKVASGEAPSIIKKAKLKHVNELNEHWKEQDLDLAKEVGVNLAEEVSKIKSSSEE